jgi:UDP-GlcNAc:undecaprenyl-phosphate GlcNAc-1-phosphate transferase
MMENPVWLLVTSAYAVLSTWIVCLLAEDLGKRWRLMDYPDARKAHAHPTPLIGGIALLAVIFPIMPVIGVLFEPGDIGNAALTILALATAGCAAIGIADDRHGLSAVSRLVITLLLFAAAIAFDERFLIDQIWFSWSDEPVVLPYWLSWAFTLTVLVGFINAVNMADGKNGLVLSMCLIWSFLLTAVGPFGLVIVMLPLVLMLCVLFIYNLQGRVFLGDGGAYGLAACFGLVAIYSYNLGGGAISADLLTLFFIVPGFDMIRLFAVRIARGQSPMAGDRDHFHHHLLRLTGWPFGLIIYAAMLILPSVAGVFVPSLVAWLLGATIITYCLVLVVSYRRHPAVTAGSNGTDIPLTD